MNYLRSLLFVCLCFFGIAFSFTSCASKKALTTDRIEAEFNPKDHPLVLRRTTLVVRDIKKSLAFYKDAIGMEVIYDNLIKRPHKTEDREEVLRLVFLKSVHQYYGVLGLLEYDYEYADKKTKPIRHEGFTPGNVVLLFNTNDIKKFEQLKNAAGVEVLSEPSLREYPSYDGKSKIRVMMSTVYDPDGFLVEYNQLLDDL